MNVRFLNTESSEGYDKLMLESEQLLDTLNSQSTRLKRLNTQIQQSIGPSVGSTPNQAASPLRQQVGSPLGMGDEIGTGAGINRKTRFMQGENRDVNYDLNSDSQFQHIAQEIPDPKLNVKAQQGNYEYRQKLSRELEMRKKAGTKGAGMNPKKLSDKTGEPLKSSLRHEGEGGAGPVKIGRVGKSASGIGAGIGRGKVPLNR